jgi:hypothetical protein
MPTAVSVLVADLRREPIAAKRGHERDFLQETQLLYGETVSVLQKKGKWCFIEALQQPKYVEGRGWQGYNGWIETDHLHEVNQQAASVIQEPYASIYHAPDDTSLVCRRLSFGSFVHVQSTLDDWNEVLLPCGQSGFIRRKPPLSVLEKACFFIGQPYLWGGCSSFWPEWQGNTGVDCSALVHLLYRTQGSVIPRDAADQCRLAAPVPDLIPGDLVFRSNAQGERVDHVMIYGGGEWLIEACLDAACIRRITFVDKYGLTLKELEGGKNPRNDYLMFRRIFAA